MKKIYFLPLLLVFNIALGQENFKISATLSGGITITHTDIKRYTFAPATTPESEIRPAGKGSVSFYFNDHSGINFKAGYYGLAGISPEKNLKFDANIITYSANLRIAFNKPLKETLPDKMARRWKLFLDIGYGKLTYETTVTKLNNDLEIQAENDTYMMGLNSFSSGVVPLELNIMFKLTDKDLAFWNRGRDRYFLVFNAGMHITGKDELDGYISKDFTNDAFSHYALGIAYFFGR